MTHTRLTAVVEDQLRAIVGATHVRPAVPGDMWVGAARKGGPESRAAPPLGAAFSEGVLIVEPATEHELAAVLRCADDAGLAVIPRGGGTKLNWGNPPSRADVILSLVRLNRVVEHAWADLTVTVEAGCTVADLQEALAQHGQRLAMDVLWPEWATVGGMLSTNDSGALRLRYGALRDLVIGVTLALADGTLAASGGKVVKNVAGYDLPKLATGALGTLGVITRATFRLHPLPLNTRTLSVRLPSVAAMQDFVLAVQESRLAHAALQARLHQGGAPEVDVLFEGTEAGIAAQEASIRQLGGNAVVSIGSEATWAARQDLWLADTGPHPSTLPEGEGTLRPGGTALGAIVKLSMLPSDLGATIASIERLTAGSSARWSAVVQATGVGYLRLDGAPDDLAAMLLELRGQLELGGGSLVILRHTPGDSPLDAWGSPGDALPLMRAVKLQFDPNGTLNPGRFVGGI